jgi:hypothetical protein
LHDERLQGADQRFVAVANRPILLGDAGFVGWVIAFGVFFTLMFGGVFGSAANGAYDVQRAVGGKAHDDALKAAVDEVRASFAADVAGMKAW